MIFEIDAVKNVAPGKQRLAKFYYDNMTSKLTTASGELIYADVAKQQNPNPIWQEAEITDPTNPLGKDGEHQFRVLKIQLGLSCNYGCEYCSQRFVPHADNGNPATVQKFMKNLDKWLKHPPKKIEYWGGEPFVYWKTLKPLAEALKEKFPDTKISVITNGSLLNPEINEWIDKLGFSVGLSHDGPGQPVRGPDPFDDPEQKKNILDLWHRLGHKRMSFNSMIHRENMDRAAIQQYFRNLLQTDDFTIGEGSYIDSYDEGGLKNALDDKAEQLGYRRLALEQIRSGKNDRFHITNSRLKEWISSISQQRPASTLMQKCGMDRPDTIAVDLNGNVLSCQNVSAVAIAPNKKSHRIGHVSKIDDVKLTTSTHWSLRQNCSDCPMLQTCKGSCMYLENELWDKSCDSNYNDHLPYFAAAFEVLTGYLPFRINGDHLPEERRNLWGGPTDRAVVPKVREAVV